MELLGREHRGQALEASRRAQSPGLAAQLPVPRLGERLEVPAEQVGLLWARDGGMRAEHVLEPGRARSRRADEQHQCRSGVPAVTHAVDPGRRRGTVAHGLLVGLARLLATRDGEVGGSRPRASFTRVAGDASSPDDRVPEERAALPAVPARRELLADLVRVAGAPARALSPQLGQVLLEHEEVLDPLPRRRS